MSLILLAVGCFLIAASTIQYFKVSAESAETGTIVIAEAGKAVSESVSAHLNNFFLKRSILGGVFILCAVVLHLLIRREKNKAFMLEAPDLVAVTPTRSAVSDPGEAIPEHS